MRLLPAVVRKSIKQMLEKAIPVLDSLRRPKIEGQEHIAGLDTTSIHHSCALVVRCNSKYPKSRIAFGEGVYLGERVEFEAAGEIEIGQDTSLQHGCAVRGEVRIGAHCLFGQNVLVISSEHKFRDRPEWLIRDQDRASTTLPPDGAQQAIRIEDDCWLGWGSVVLAGVTIGRGAVIGANCVVTRDVGPYEIHAGIPNRKIGERLAFAPPSRLDCMNDASLPFFYRGFFHARAALEQSRARNVIGAQANACLVMASCNHGELQIQGRADLGPCRLRIGINGQDTGVHDLPAGAFTLNLQIPNDGAQAKNAPARENCTLIELRLEAGAQRAGAVYGITSATLTAAPANQTQQA